MWAKLAQWAATALLIPLLKQAGLAIYKWVVSVFATKEKEKKNQEASDAYANSTSPTSSGDNFADLP